MKPILSGMPDHATPYELSCEYDRMNCVRAMKIVDAPPPEGCTTLVECVARYFRVPIAFFSVIADTRQHFKAQVGLEIEGSSRDDSFCKRTILQSNVYSVADASRDNLYADSPLVWSDPYIKFYAGAPVLIDRRYAIGSLCIADHRPRVIDEAQKKMLRHFSIMLAGLIEIHHLDREKIYLVRPKSGDTSYG